MIKKWDACVASKENSVIPGEYEETNILANKELPPNVKHASIITVKPGGEIEYHQHTGESEICYIISGSGEYTEGGTTAVIETGDTAVVYDGQAHGIRNTGDSDLAIASLISYSLNPFII